MTKVTAQAAGYMELGGAVKDGSCSIVNVTGGISLRKGCCNLYRPKAAADEFRCGECKFSSRPSAHREALARLSGGG